MVNNISSNPNVSAAFDLAKDSLSLAKAVSGGNLQEILKSTGKLFQDMGNLTGGTAGSNAAKEAPMPSKLSTKDMMKLFGMGMEAEQENKTKQAVDAAKSGAPESLAALLSMVGKLLVSAQKNLSAQITEQAKKLDSQTKSKEAGGATFEDQQKLSELTQALQDVRQALTQIVQTVSNLSKEENSARSSVIRNLSA